MNPEIKQRWINALCSGEYKQDRCSLKTPKGFCCLGVLTDLYIKEHNLKIEKESYNRHLRNRHKGTLTGVLFVL